MATRAVYTFKDSADTFAIYKHHDGYPSGAAEWLTAGFNKSWSKDGGAFEAAELAASFVAANKDGAGGVYLSKGQRYHGDLSYDYVISNKKGDAIIQVYEHRWVKYENSLIPYDKKRVRIFQGTFAKFIEKYKKKIGD